MKKTIIPFTGMVEEFKLNSNKQVLKENIGNIFPGIGANKDNGYLNVKTFNLTRDNQNKLNKLRAKYKISRSAIIRILLDNMED